MAVDENSNIINFDNPYLEHLGTKEEFLNGEIIYTQTWAGHRDKLEDLAAQWPMLCSSPDGHGTLESKEITQAEGPHWRLVVKWSKDTMTSVHFGTGTSYGPKMSTLDTTMMQRELENHPHYKKRWNNNFYANRTYVTLTDEQRNRIDDIWHNGTYENDHIAANEVYLYAWGKSAAELPPFDELGHKCIWETPVLVLDNVTKRLIMTKPGVDYYVYPSYVLHEKAKCSTKERTAWVIKQRSGKIATPLNGDFGIVKKFGGDWLCIGGTIEFDGKYWVASLSYEYSPSGWDTSLYNDV